MDGQTDRQILMPPDYRHGGIIEALQALHDAPATALTSSKVTIRNFYTSSGHALYLYQVLRN